MYWKGVEETSVREATKNTRRSLFTTQYYLRWRLLQTVSILSGCSVARLSRLLWEQKVVSSNLTIPTYLMDPIKFIVTDNVMNTEIVKISSLRQVSITNKYELVGLMYRVVLIPDEYKDHPLYSEVMKYMCLSKR